MTLVDEAHARGLLVPAHIIEQPAAIHNWSKTFQFTPELLLQPSTEAELVRAVLFSKEHNRRIRVLGAGHSPSDIMATNAVCVNLDKYNRVLKVDVEERQIKVQAGIRIRDINKTLHDLGLGLSNLGSISDQSISGAISTGTHGTGYHFGILATMIVAMDLITADGAIHKLSRTSNPDLFLASLCGLGCLGIISTVTIQCEDAFKLEAAQTSEKLEDVLRDTQQLFSSAEHVRFWWFPNSENVIVWRANRSQKPTSNQGNYFVDTILGFHVLQTALYISSFLPAMTPWINQTFFGLLFQQSKIAVDDSPNIFNFDCLFQQYVSEWAIPSSQTAYAIRSLKFFIEKEKLIAHFPVEVRYVKQDDIWMSPAFGQDVVFIGIIIYRPFGVDIPREKYWQRFEQLMTSLGGRPHWAKEHPLAKEDLAKVYPKLPSFLALREKYDPNGVFLNEYLERHLVPRRAVEKAKL